MPYDKVHLFQQSYTHMKMHIRVECLQRMVGIIQKRIWYNKMEGISISYKICNEDTY